MVMKLRKGALIRKDGRSLFCLALSKPQFGITSGLAAPLIGLSGSTSTKAGERSPNRQFMELAEIIEAVKGTDPEEFGKALHEGSQKHWQIMFSEGHKSGKGQTMEKVDQLQAQVKQLEEDLQVKGEELLSKDDEIKKAMADKPDLEKIKTEYEQKLVDKDTHYDEKLKEAQAKHAELQKTILEKQKARYQQEIVNKLQGLHVDVWAAQRAVDSSVMDRIQVNDDDTAKVYQPDGSTPYMPAEGQTAIDLLAREIVETIPESMVRPPKNNGSNYQKGGEPKSNSETRKRSEFSRSDRIAFISEHGREAYEALPS